MKRGKERNEKHGDDESESLAMELTTKEDDLE